GRRCAARAGGRWTVRRAFRYSTTHDETRRGAHRVRGPGPHAPARAVPHSRPVHAGAPHPAPARPLRHPPPQAQAALLEIYKELVEINPTDAVGYSMVAARVMAARL